MGLVKRNFAYRRILVKLYKSLVWPHLDNAMEVWSPHLEKDKKTIYRESADKGDPTHSAIPSLKNLSYEERLSRLNLTTLEKRRQRGDLMDVKDHDPQNDQQGLSWHTVTASESNISQHKRTPAKKKKN